MEMSASKIQGKSPTNLCIDALDSADLCVMFLYSETCSAGEEMDWYLAQPKYVVGSAQTFTTIMCVCMCAYVCVCARVCMCVRVIPIWVQPYIKTFFISMIKCFTGQDYHWCNRLQKKTDTEIKRKKRRTEILWNK